MSNQKQRNPDIDFGFHANVPRIVRTGYKSLTPVQKWLYVCLKDLCGEYGTCYRTIKILSDETGISTGMLSESIPILHTAGLIHAEKKKRSTGGKEVWHITIVDVWEANGKAHPTKHSLREQERSHSEQTLENVHTVNENVHRMNDMGKERSQNELERSLCETEEGSGEAGSFIEEGSSEEEKERVFASAPTPSSSLNHDTSMPHNEVSCTLWQRCNKKSCADFQAAIDANHISEADLLQLLASYEDEQEREMHRLANAYEPQGATHASPPPVLPARAPTLDRLHSDEPATTQSLPLEGEINGQSIDRHRDRQHLPQHLASGPAPGAIGNQDGATPPQRGHGRDTTGANDGRAAHPQQMTSDLSPTDGAATERGSAPRASGGKVHQQKAKKKPSEVQVTLEGQQIIEWYEEYRGLKVRRTDKQMIAANAIGARGVTKDDFLSVVALLDDDPWFEKNGIGIDLYWIERQFDNKYIFLKKRKKPEPPKERTLGGYYFVGGQ